MSSGCRRRAACALIVLVLATPALARAGQTHDHMQMPAADTGWRLMQDGVVYALFNRQGGPRGGTEVVVPNWWMGMLMRDVGKHTFGMNLMLSLDPATVGSRGYREIFQAGEVFDGLPIVDRQHPHDFVMQAALTWRIPLGGHASLTLAGGPVGEPTLGPVAFMHRASAAGLPFAPLGHHTFDSTHISAGVMAASLTSGRWTIEGSAFNAREPDEHRWDVDLGAFDSVAGRVWFRPAADWELQGSTGMLRDPEALEPGDARRTTASMSWYAPNHTSTGQPSFSAVTVGYGVNIAQGIRRHGAFGEFNIERSVHSVFGRLEVQEVEAHLLPGSEPRSTGDHGRPVVTAATVGAARRVIGWKGFDGAAGAEATLYRVPQALTETYGKRPVSFQLFFRLRLPSAARMWETRMTH